MTHTILILQLTIALTLQSGACRNNKMNNNQRSEPPKNAVSATPTPQTSNSRVATGTWSGPNISMEVTESGARVEFVCAHGTMGEPLILKDGRFTVPGTFVRERGGPTREGESEKGTPVQYRGEFDGERLTLTFSVAGDGSDAETFSLTRGTHGRLIKCK